MTATSLLLILIGVFIILNSSNFVKVLKGEARLSVINPSSSSTSGQGVATTGSADTGSGNVEVTGGLSGAR